jgi:hypothetical protein
VLAGWEAMAVGEWVELQEGMVLGTKELAGMLARVMVGLEGKEEVAPGLMELAVMGKVEMEEVALGAKEVVAGWAVVVERMSAGQLYHKQMIWRIMGNCLRC